MWSKNLFDTEGIVREFYSSCFNAETKCDLRSPDDTDGESVQPRVEALLHNITDQLETWVSHGFSEIITAQDVRALFTIPIYMPIPFFERPSSALAALLKGNFHRNSPRCAKGYSSSSRSLLHR